MRRPVEPAIGAAGLKHHESGKPVPERSTAGSAIANNVDTWLTRIAQW